MANVITNPTNFPRRVNEYVRAMMYSADVNYNGFTRVGFGAPLAPNPTYALSGGSLNNANTTIDLTGIAPFLETYGRTATIVGSGAGATGVVTLYGWDYLGQPIRTDITLNGVTPVAIPKAYKSFQSLVSPTAQAGITVNIGTGPNLGLPYKALRVEWEVANGVAVAAGTLTPPVLTDPQTATSGDPRGTYAPTTALNGTNIISAAFDFANDVNTSNNGGLHGIQQYTA
jgi:hypothetical protein